MTCYTPEEKMIREDQAQLAATFAAMDASRDYGNLIAELTLIEKANNLYLTDTNIDLENVDRSLVYGSAEYFRNLISCASMAAGMRAEEAGFDLNAALGRSIY